MTADLDDPAIRSSAFNELITNRGHQSRFFASEVARLPRNHPQKSALNQVGAFLSNIASYERQFRNQPEANQKAVLRQMLLEEIGLEKIMVENTECDGMETGFNLGTIPDYDQRLGAIIGELGRAPGFIAFDEIFDKDGRNGYKFRLPKILVQAGIATYISENAVQIATSDPVLAGIDGLITSLSDQNPVFNRREFENYRRDYQQPRYTDAVKRLNYLHEIRNQADSILNILPHLEFHSNAVEDRVKVRVATVAPLIRRGVPQPITEFERVLDTGALEGLREFRNVLAEVRFLMPKYRLLEANFDRTAPGNMDKMNNAIEFLDKVMAEGEVEPVNLRIDRLNADIQARVIDAIKPGEINRDPRGIVERSNQLRGDLIALYEDKLFELRADPAKARDAQQLQHVIAHMQTQKDYYENALNGGIAGPLAPTVPQLALSTIVSTIGDQELLRTTNATFAAENLTINFRTLQLDDLMPVLEQYRVERFGTFVELDNTIPGYAVEMQLLSHNMATALLIEMQDLEFNGFPSEAVAERAARYMLDDFSIKGSPKELDLNTAYAFSEALNFISRKEIRAQFLASLADMRFDQPRVSTTNGLGEFGTSTVDAQQFNFNSGPDTRHIEQLARELRPFAAQLAPLFFGNEAALRDRLALQENYTAIRDYVEQARTLNTQLEERLDRGVGEASEPFFVNQIIANMAERIALQERVEMSGLTNTPRYFSEAATRRARININLLSSPEFTGLSFIEKDLVVSSSVVTYLLIEDGYDIQNANLGAPIGNIVNAQAREIISTMSANPSYNLTAQPTLTIGNSVENAIITARLLMESTAQASTKQSADRAIKDSFVAQRSGILRRFEGYQLGGDRLDVAVAFLSTGAIRSLVAQIGATGIKGYLLDGQPGFENIIQQTSNIISLFNSPHAAAHAEGVRTLLQSPELASLILTEVNKLPGLEREKLTLQNLSDLGDAIAQSMIDNAPPIAPVLGYTDDSDDDLFANTDTPDPSAAAQDTVLYENYSLMGKEPIAFKTPEATAEYNAFLKQFDTSLRELDIHPDEDGNLFHLQSNEMRGKIEPIFELFNANIRNRLLLDDRIADTDQARNTPEMRLSLIALADYADEMRDAYRNGTLNGPYAVTVLYALRTAINHDSLRNAGLTNELRESLGPIFALNAEAAIADGNQVYINGFQQFLIQPEIEATGQTAPQAIIDSLEVRASWHALWDPINELIAADSETITDDQLNSAFLYLRSINYKVMAIETLQGRPPSRRSLQVELDGLRKVPTYTQEERRQLQANLSNYANFWFDDYNPGLPAAPDQSGGDDNNGGASDGGNPEPVTPITPPPTAGGESPATGRIAPSTEYAQTGQLQKPADLLNAKTGKLGESQEQASSDDVAVATEEPAAEPIQTLTETASDDRPAEIAKEESKPETPPVTLIGSNVPVVSTPTTLPTEGEKVEAAWSEIAGTSGSESVTEGAVAQASVVDNGDLTTPDQGEEEAAPTTETITTVEEVIVPETTDVNTVEKTETAPAEIAPVVAQEVQTEAVQAAPQRAREVNDERSIASDQLASALYPSNSERAYDREAVEDSLEYMNLAELNISKNGTLSTAIRSDILRIQNAINTDTDSVEKMLALEAVARVAAGESFEFLFTSPSGAANRALSQEYRSRVRAILAEPQKFAIPETFITKYQDQIKDALTTVESARISVPLKSIVSPEGLEQKTNSVVIQKALSETVYSSKAVTELENTKQREALEDLLEDLNIDEWHKTDIKTAPELSTLRIDLGKEIAAVAELENSVAGMMALEVVARVKAGESFEFLFTGNEDEASKAKAAEYREAAKQVLKKTLEVGETNRVFSEKFVNDHKGEIEAAISAMDGNIANSESTPDTPPPSPTTPPAPQPSPTPTIPPAPTAQSSVAPTIISAAAPSVSTPLTTAYTPSSAVFSSGVVTNPVDLTRERALQAERLAARTTQKSSPAVEVLTTQPTSDETPPAVDVAIETTATVVATQEEAPQESTEQEETVEVVKKELIDFLYSHTGETLTAWEAANEWSNEEGRKARDLFERLHNAELDSQTDEAARAGRETLSTTFEANPDLTSIAVLLTNEVRARIATGRDPKFLFAGNGDERTQAIGQEYLKQVTDLFAGDIEGAEGSVRISVEKIKAGIAEPSEGYYLTRLASELERRKNAYQILTGKEYVTETSGEIANAILEAQQEIRNIAVEIPYGENSSKLQINLSQKETGKISELSATEATILAKDENLTDAGKVRELVQINHDIVYTYASAIDYEWKFSTPGVRRTELETAENNTDRQLLIRRVNLREQHDLSLTLGIELLATVGMDQESKLAEKILSDTDGEKNRRAIADALEEFVNSRGGNEFNRIPQDDLNVYLARTLKALVGEEGGNRPVEADAPEITSEGSAAPTGSIEAGVEFSTTVAAPSSETVNSTDLKSDQERVTFTIETAAGKEAVSITLTEDESRSITSLQSGKVKMERGSFGRKSELRKISEANLGITNIYLNAVQREIQQQESAKLTDPVRPQQVIKQLKSLELRLKTANGVREFIVDNAGNDEQTFNSLYGLEITASAITTMTDTQGALKDIFEDVEYRENTKAALETLRGHGMGDYYKRILCYAIAKNQGIPVDEATFVELNRHLDNGVKALNAGNTISISSTTNFGETDRLPAGADGENLSDLENGQQGVEARVETELPVSASRWKAEEYTTGHTTAQEVIRRVAEERDFEDVFAEGEMGQRYRAAVIEILEEVIARENPELKDGPARRALEALRNSPYTVEGSPTQQQTAESPTTYGREELLAADKAMKDEIKTLKNNPIEASTRFAQINASRIAQLEQAATSTEQERTALAARKSLIDARTKAQAELPRERADFNLQSFDYITEVALRVAEGFDLEEAIVTVFVPPLVLPSSSALSRVADLLGDARKLFNGQQEMLAVLENAESRLNELPYDLNDVTIKSLNPRA